MAMLPLQHSHEATQLEADIKALTIRLYEMTLAEAAEDINVYGAPHLGSFSLVERNVTKDGLTVLREGDEAQIRYLYRAWRSRNPQRGMHFLKTYLQVLFGDTYFVNQMWQDKNQVYPTKLRTKDEIGYSGQPMSDYYLTSRVTVDIDTTIIPDRIVKSLRSTVAARFLLDVRVAKFQSNVLGLGQQMGGAVLCFGSGEVEVKTQPMVINELAFVIV